MFQVMKNQGKLVEAYRLGEESPALRELMEKGLLLPLDDGRFEVFSQESVNGGSGHGQIANNGDYLKVDGGGFPYPNGAEYFVANHRHIEGDTYEQKTLPLNAWTANEPMCPEIAFLVEHMGLVLDFDHPERFFSAPLWGTVEVAAKDAVLVFYSIDYGENGEVKDASFNFIGRAEFERTYHVL